MYQTYIGNPFTFFEDGDTICVTTNGIVKSDGCAVMGAGIAEFVRDAFEKQKIDRRLGIYLLKYGNMSFYLGEYEFPLIKDFEMSQGKILRLASFPTKYHYKNKSSLKLIKKSVEEIIERANKFHMNLIYIPFPGGGKGKLKWSEVQPLLTPLDDRFIVFSTEKSDFDKLTR